MQKHVFFHTVYCLQFSKRCQIRYLDNKLSTCTNVLQWAVNMSVTDFVFLSMSRWFVRIFVSSLVQQTSFTLLMWLRWNLINLWHDEFTGIALVDVAIFLRNSRTNSTGCVYEVEFTVMYRNEPKSELWARVAQLVEYQPCKLGSWVRSLPTYVIF